MAGYGLGFINSPGLFLYLIVTVITATSTAVFLIYENRYFVLFGDNSWWKHVRKPAIVASYIMVPIYFLPAQFLIPEQQEARKVVWKALECQPELPVHRELFVLSTDFIAPAYSIIIAEGVPAVQISTFFGINLYLLLFAEPSSRISERTMKLQKKLAFALFVQSYAILMLFTVPINVVVYIIKFEYQSQTVNNFVFIALSAHGSLSTLIMIFVHKPYRDFVLSPFRKMLRKVPTILVTSNAASRTFVE